MNKAVFLDRDGVINDDVGYVFKPEDFVFKEDIFDFCCNAQSKGYLLILVTNQSGIARGYYSEEDFLRLTEWMCAEFEKRDIHIEKVYYCPFHAEKGVGKYKKSSCDRKPEPGMLLKAKKEFDIDMERSIVLGDRNSDTDAGRNAGVKKLLLLRGNYEIRTEPDVIVINSMREAEQYL